MIDRYFDWRSAFDHPVTCWLMGGISLLLAICPLIFSLLDRAGVLNEKLRADLWTRWRSWLVLMPLMTLPVLLGAGPTMIAATLLALACYREFARATGLFRERLTSFAVVAGIGVAALAMADHWYELFVATTPLTVALIAATAVLADQPKGYIQRVALGSLAFLLFGSAILHLGYLANDRDYRPILLLLLAAVELNDVFAYAVGKTLGRRKLAPHTSPGKTVAGAMGALLLTTAFVCVTAEPIFRGTPLARPLPLVVLGVMISFVGQIGDLVLSSVKRDLGIKDIGAAIPGHGGLLDRFDSLLLVAPAAFHYIGYFVGLGDETPRRFFTGG